MSNIFIIGHEQHIHNWSPSAMGDENIQAVLRGQPRPDSGTCKITFLRCLQQKLVCHILILYILLLYTESVSELVMDVCILLGPPVQWTVPMYVAVHNNIHGPSSIYTSISNTDTDTDSVYLQYILQFIKGPLERRSGHTSWPPSGWRPTPTPTWWPS